MKVKVTADVEGVDFASRFEGKFRSKRLFCFSAREVFEPVPEAFTD